MLRTWVRHLNFYKKLKLELTIWYFKLTLEVKFTKKIDNKLGPQKDLEIIYKVNNVS